MHFCTNGLIHIDVLSPLLPITMKKNLQAHKNCTSVGLMVMWCCTLLTVSNITFVLSSWNTISWLCSTWTQCQWNNITILYIMDFWMFLIKKKERHSSFSLSNQAASRCWFSSLLHLLTFSNQNWKLQDKTLMEIWKQFPYLYSHLFLLWRLGVLLQTKIKHKFHTHFWVDHWPSNKISQKPLQTFLVPNFSHSVLPK